MIERDQIEEQMALRDFYPEATLNQRKPVIKFQNPDRLDNSLRVFTLKSASPSSLDQMRKCKN
jgi:hypothetical protein